MVESTREQTALRDIEERLENRMVEKLEKRMVELAGSLQRTMEASLKQAMEELMRKNNQDSEKSEKSPKSRSFNSEEPKCTPGARYIASGDKNPNSSHFASATTLPIVEFPRQRGSVMEYHEDFDAIITRLDLSEEYTLNCFLDGLKNDIQMMVRMFQPQTVRKAFVLAKLYESANNNNSTVSTGFALKNRASVNNKPLISTKPTPSVESDLLKSRPEINRNLSPAFMNEGRAIPGHNLSHKKVQLHLIELEDAEPEKVVEEIVDSKEYGEPYILVDILTVAEPEQRKKPLHLVIDSGKNHKFLTKKLGCMIEELEPLLVTVADGNKLQRSSIIQNFKWKLNHNTSQFDIMMMPLGCCDMKLGVNWLVILDDTTWNLDKLRLELLVVGKRHVLRGASYETKLELIGSSSSKREEILRALKFHFSEVKEDKAVR